MGTWGHSVTWWAEHYVILPRPASRKGSRRSKQAYSWRWEVIAKQIFFLLALPYLTDTMLQRVAGVCGRIRLDGQTNHV